MNTFQNMNDTSRSLSCLFTIFVNKFGFSFLDFLSLDYDSNNETAWNSSKTCTKKAKHSVHTTLQEFEKGGSTLKTHQMLPVHTKEFKNAAISGYFGFVFPQNSVFKVFEFEKKTKKAFSNFSGFKSAFEKVRFRDGLTNCRNKAVFSNISGIM